MKPIRTSILECLLQHGEQTAEELHARISGYRKQQIAANLSSARHECLVVNRIDDVTHMPAYRITEAGKMRLAELLDSAANNTCCNGAGVVAKTAGAQIAELKKQRAEDQQRIADLEMALDVAKAIIRRMEREAEGVEREAA